MTLVSFTSSPCLSCGACCAYYRASFYWAESDNAPGGTVPTGLTEKLDHFRLIMKGTDKKPPRCDALHGTIGESVYCFIYNLRASVCRDFSVSWENGEPNERCDRARAKWGLNPLEPFLNDKPDDRPKAA